MFSRSTDKRSQKQFTISTTFESLYWVLSSCYPSHRWAELFPGPLVYGSVIVSIFVPLVSLIFLRRYCLLATFFLLLTAQEETWLLSLISWVQCASLESLMSLGTGMLKVYFQKLSGGRENTWFASLPLMISILLNFSTLLSTYPIRILWLKENFQGSISQYPNFF